MVKKSTDKSLEIIVTNGCKDSFVQDTHNDVHSDSSPRDRSNKEAKPVDPSLEQTGNTVVCVHQGIVLRYFFV